MEFPWTNEKYKYCTHLALLGSHALCKYKWHTDQVIADAKFFTKRRVANYYMHLSYSVALFLKMILCQNLLYSHLFVKGICRMSVHSTFKVHYDGLNDVKNTTRVEVIITISTALRMSNNKNFGPYIPANFYSNCYLNFNQSSIFEKMTSFPQILNQDLETRKLNSGRKFWK